MSELPSQQGSLLQHRRLSHLIYRLIRVKPSEVRALLWSWLYFFCVLSAYYILRPIRDERGIASGTGSLQWLFTSTLVAMLIVNIPFAALTKRLTRVCLISVVYRFFIANLLIFAVLFAFTDEPQAIWVGRGFFVWASVFNLYVVSIFWILMVDVFDSEQGKRLFGVIAAGGTIGAIAGSATTMVMGKHIAPLYLLIASAILLEVAVLCVRRLSKISEALRHRPRHVNEESPIAGNVFSGFSNTFKSGYLVNVSLYLFLTTITGTALYFQQAEIVRTGFTSAQERTSFLAFIDLLVNCLTLAVQLFLTGRIVGLMGVSLTLSILPVLSALGFAALFYAPTFANLVIFQVTRRAGSFAVANPTRELLFTVVSREDKYRSKSFIDTVVYRSGDQIGAWSNTLLSVVGLGPSAVALMAIPISLMWLINAFWLGRKQESLARTHHS